jgi:hypothetical protein
MAALIGWSTPAWAPFHLVVIEQIYFGNPDCPNAQYVQLRTLNAFMVFVNGQGVTNQTADGSAAPAFGSFTKNLTRTDAGVAMLIGTAEAEALFDLPFDQVVSGSLVQSDGRVCFGNFGGDEVDCVAYGNFTGDNGHHGDPAPRPQLGDTLVRISETDDNAADFVLGTPAPENNAGAVGALGQCGGVAPTATPTATPIAGGDCVGDCNGDGMVAINELIVMVNIALGSSPASACPVDCGDLGVDISCLVRAVNNALSGCPAVATPTGVPTGTASATVAATPTRTPGGPLGLRRVSLNPSSSRIINTLGPGFAFPTSGFQGFLELSAGVPDPTSGYVFVDLVDASEYLALSIPTGGVALCLRVDRSQLPVRNAGIMNCNGGAALGLQLTQDRNVGFVGACAGGEQDGLPCAADTDCPGATCFTADACSAGNGVLEGEEDAFPGVCQGPLVGGTLAGDSGAGALLLSPDPTNGLTKGVPMRIITESALPCGDEPSAPGFDTDMALTTGLSRCTVTDYNNNEGALLTTELSGAPFECATWDVENGPGTLVVAAPSLNLSVNGAPTDSITSFVFDD